MATPGHGAAQRQTKSNLILARLDSRRPLDRYVCRFPADCETLKSARAPWIHVYALPTYRRSKARFLLQQMVVVAELEAGMISARTKAALAASKRRGVQLGGDRGVAPSDSVRAQARRVVQQRANERASDIAGKIAELEAAGKTTLRQIAEGLNAAGIPTARGEGEWSAVQVQRVQVRLHAVA